MKITVPVYEPRSHRLKTGRQQFAASLFCRSAAKKILKQAGGTQKTLL